MQFIIEALYIIIISLIFVAIDLNNYSGKCIVNLDMDNKKQAMTIIFIHHLIATLAIFGCLFSSKIILTLFCITIILIITIGLINGRKCFLTIKINKLCYFKNYNYFPDFFYLIGMKKFDFWNKWGYNVFYISVFFIGIYKLFIF